jgi:hypothetical protein
MGFGRCKDFGAIVLAKDYYAEHQGQNASQENDSDPHCNIMNYRRFYFQTEARLTNPKNPGKIGHE